MIRPLIFAIIEYILAYLVFRYGKVHKNVFALILFFLATYQFGEVILFLTNGDMLGFRVAYVATTMLPPLGVLLVEKVTKKRYGYEIFQLISFGLIAYIITAPEIALRFALSQFCIKVYEYNSVMSTYWQYFYQITLIVTMIILTVNILRTKVTQERVILKNILLGYLIFNGLGIVITMLVPDMRDSMTSLICALAFFSAFLFAKTALGIEGNFMSQKIRSILSNNN